MSLLQLTIRKKQDYILFYQAETKSSQKKYT